MNQTLTFFGDYTRRPTNPHPDSPKEPEPYVADAELIRAVNLAIYLRRPLLLEGEAGCGKTRLATAVAYELGLPFYRWNVNSASKARDGLYTYDAILRLHDIHAQQAGAYQGERNPQDATHYRQFGALGKAFTLVGATAVVLIDEIDKADIDFPNDLLAVLDKPWRFEIPETGEIVTADENSLPIVIITSNKEKGNLPAPFLRRCLYHFIRFPDRERLEQIVSAHYAAASPDVPPASLLQLALDRFLQLRQEGGLYKLPGTSEFLDWLKALHGFRLPHLDAPVLTAAGELPFPQVLFKLRADWPALRP